MKIIVDVTEQDIKNGLRGSGKDCAIARALRRVVAVPVLVGSHEMCVGDKETGSIYLLPSAAVAFISAFDNQRPVKPFSFELDVDPYLPLRPVIRELPAVALRYPIQAAEIQWVPVCLSEISVPATAPVSEKELVLA